MNCQSSKLYCSLYLAVLALGLLYLSHRLVAYFLKLLTCALVCRRRLNRRYYVVVVEVFLTEDVYVRTALVFRAFPSVP